MDIKIDFNIIDLKCGIYTIDFNHLSIIWSIATYIRYDKACGIP